MVLATGGPCDFVLKHFDEFYSLEWVPGPENREKPAKITKNQFFHEIFFEIHVFLEFFADHFGHGEPPKLSQNRNFQNFTNFWKNLEKIF